jgi:hypothetical protein
MIKSTKYFLPNCGYINSFDLVLLKLFDFGQNGATFFIRQTLTIH